MLTRVEVKSFKSLFDVALDLGRVNVFVGANGVGKSNLLEAIGVLGAAADGRVDDGALLRRGVRPGVPAIYKSSFKNEKMSPQIALGARSDEAHYAVSLRNPIDDPQEAWTYFSERLFEGDVKVVGRSPNSAERIDPARGLAALEMVEHLPGEPSAKLMAALQGYRIYTPDTHTLRGLVSDPQQQEPLGLSGGRLADAVQATLDALGDAAEGAREAVSDLLDWVDSFDVAPATVVPMSRAVPTTQFVLRFRDRFMREERNRVSGYDASEGVLLVLFLMVLGLHPKAPAVFAVDNVDHGLNPRLARRLMAIFTEWVLSRDDRQVFFTAHNPLVLDGLRLTDDRVRLFTVDRSLPSGHTRYHRVEVTPELLARSKEGWTLSRMWVNGLLGGVPDV